MLRCNIGKYLFLSLILGREIRMQKYNKSHLCLTSIVSELRVKENFQSIKSQDTHFKKSTVDIVSLGLNVKATVDSLYHIQNTQREKYSLW